MSDNMQDEELRVKLSESAQVTHPDTQKVLEAQETIVKNMVSLEVKQSPLEELLGKVAQHDVFTPNGEQMIAAGETVGGEHLEQARQHHFEAALATAVRD